VLTRRVFGIRFILRRGLQHLFLSKGALLVEGIAIFFLLQQLLLRAGSRLAASPPAVSGVSVAGALLGIGVASRVNRRIMPALDRRFFKDAVDARQLLIGLSEDLSRLRAREPILERTAATVLRALHLERVAVLVRDAGGAALRGAFALEGGHGVVPAAAPVPAAVPVLLDGDPVVDELGGEAPWVTVAPELPAAGDEAGGRLRALACELLVPLRRDGRLTGVLALGAKLSEEPFSSEDRALLAAVARELAMALENADLLEVARRESRHARELEIARQVQQNLFPPRLPRVTGWDFAALCRPAREVGGDYYDLFEIGPGRVALALGDVSGKGFGPALLMASAHALIRSRLGRDAGDLPGLAGELNEHLLRSSSPGMFLTLFVGVLDARDGGLRYVNAGHVPPMLLDVTGAAPRRLETGGTVVGILPDAAFEEGWAELAAGSLLALFSDGVTEAEDEGGGMFEEARTAAVLGRGRSLPAAAVVESMLGAVDAFAAGREQSDDISIIVVKREAAATKTA